MSMKILHGRLAAAVLAALVLALVTVLVVAASHGRIGQAAAQAGHPTPTPAPRNAAGGASTPSAPPSAPGKRFVPPPAIADALQGAVLHLVETQYNYVPASPDPANGKQVTIDSWIQTDSSGEIAKMHAITTLPDGTFLQEVVEANGKRIVAFGPAYSALLPAVGNPCTPKATGSPRPLMALFVDQSTLPQLGYSMAQATAALPVVLSSPALPGVTPLRTFEGGTATQAWVELGPAGLGQTNTYEIDVRSDGSIASMQGVLKDAEGKVVNENRQTYGAIQLYSPSSVPPSVFGQSEAGKEACHA